MPAAAAFSRLTGAQQYANEAVTIFVLISVYGSANPSAAMAVMATMA